MRFYSGRVAPEGLSAQAESSDEPTIPIVAGAAKVGEMSPSSSDQLEESAPSRVVVLVLAKMQDQLVDPPGEHGDLDIGGAGIGGVKMMLLDNFALG